MTAAIQPDLSPAPGIIPGSGDTGSSAQER